MTSHVIPPTKTVVTLMVSHDAIPVKLFNDSLYMLHLDSMPDTVHTNPNELYYILTGLWLEAALFYDQYEKSCSPQPIRSEQPLC
ncbi:MAG TPA: hypothetical protein DC024_13645 [Clostridiales bacterium]|nr:hypothetical protein [Clostridiales bacterium]